MEYDFEHIEESIRLNLESCSTYDIRIAFVITHLFTVHVG
jgi:HKD family nuclease